MDQNDRNLLFAVLAFQNEYLNLSQLSAACRAWSEDKARPMSTILLEEGWIDADAQNELERLVERKLKRFGGDPRATLGAVADADARNAMRDVEDPQMTITLSQLRPLSGGISYPPQLSASPPAPYTARETYLRPQESRTRYTLTQIHGEGGLGRIWSATDADLNRDVALKELLPEQSMHPEAVKRFVREAQVTGQLEHPNIVPVYELGHRPEDEMPFYTMRFIRGRTLKDAIADYHRLRRDKQDSPLDRQRLLNAFVSICHAIGYAHSRGVIHRDLKPDNIILGPFGEVIVLDWGLAKIIDQRDEDAANDTLSVTLSADAQAHQTIRGRVMGTPAYMAPEQAEGRLEHIDARTDIYGLGAVLFEILTGRVPHQGKTVPDLLRIIVSGTVPRPREVEPSTPKALDAICATAMARKRSDRYQTAEQMAEDVLRWLADEPVSVYREPFTQRVLRWFRKNRARALTAAASLLVATAVAIVSAVLINRARQDEQNAKLQALDALKAEEIARGQATQRLREAREVVDLFLGAVGQELSYHPVAAPARARLFERAAKEYERFASQQSDDPELQAESAQAFLRLGKLRIELGQLEEALQAIEKAEASFRQLAREPAAPRQFTFRVADCRIHSGDILARLGRKEQAEQYYQDALALLDPLLESNVENQELGLLFSRALTQLAQLQSDTGRTAESEQTLVRARTVAKLFLEKAPRDRLLRAALAGIDNEYGDLLFATGREKEAAELFRESTLTLDLLVEQDPDEVNYRASLVNTYVRLALVFQAQGELYLEFETYKQAIADMRDLVRVRPDVPIFRENLAVTQLDYGQALRKAGLAGDSRPWLEQALSEYFTLTSTGEGALEPRYIEGLGASRSSLAHTLSDLGLQDDAAVYIAEALQDFSDLTAARPNEPRFREGKAIAESIHARILARQGDPEAAAQAYPPVIAELRALLQEEDLPRYRESICEAYTNLARIRLLQDDRDGAALALRQARDEWQTLVEKYPQTARYIDRLAWLLAASPVEDLRDLSRSVELSEQVTRMAPESPRYWRTHGTAQHFAGQFPAAGVSLSSSLALRKQDDGITLLVQAMNQFRQGDREQALQTRARAEAWIAKQQPADEEIRQFQQLAAAVLENGNDQP